MQKNVISAEVPGDVIREATEAINKVAELIRPFVTGLSDKERRTILKMSDKSQAFGTKVGQYCESHPEFAPAFLSIPELQKDLGLIKALRPVLNGVSVVCRDLEDTVMLAGSEAFDASLYYYNSVKFAAEKGNVNANTIYADLSKRYPGRGSRGKGENGTGGQK